MPRFTIRFEADGDLTVVAELPDDISFVVDVVEKVKATKKLAGVGVDAIGIGGIVDALAKIGVTQENNLLAGVRQGISLMGAIKTVERKLVDGSFKHGGQALMAWCAGNARIVPTPTGMRIARDDSGFGKIDPLMALFNAMALLALNPSAGEEAGVNCRKMRDCFSPRGPMGSPSDGLSSGRSSRPVFRQSSEVKIDGLFAAEIKRCWATSRRWHAPTDMNDVVEPRAPSSSCRCRCCGSMTPAIRSARSRGQGQQGRHRDHRQDRQGRDRRDRPRLVVDQGRTRPRAVDRVQGDRARDHQGNQRHSLQEMELAGTVGGDHSGERDRDDHHDPIDRHCAAGRVRPTSCAVSSSQPAGRLRTISTELPQEGTKMKTIAEQISALEAKRAASAARMEAVMQKSLDEDRTAMPPSRKNSTRCQPRSRRSTRSWCGCAELEKTKAVTAKPVIKAETAHEGSLARGGLSPVYAVPEQRHRRRTMSGARWCAR